MAKRGQPDIIRYTFGVTDRGPRALLNARAVLLTGALLVVMTALTYALLNRPAATLNLRHSPTAPSRVLNDQQQVTFFTAYLTNHRQEPLDVRLRARTPAGKNLEIRGPAGNGIDLSVGERQQLDVAVISRPVASGRALPVVFFLVDGEGRSLAKARAAINAPFQNSGDRR